jgi:hypothetical protein
MSEAEFVDEVRTLRYDFQDHARREAHENFAGLRIQLGTGSRDGWHARCGSRALNFSTGRFPDLEGMVAEAGSAIIGSPADNE